MSQENTEKATPKRREDAKRKGQIARGAELPAALGFLGALLAFNFLSAKFLRTIGAYIQNGAANCDSTRFQISRCQRFFLRSGQNSRSADSAGDRCRFDGGSRGKFRAGRFFADG